MDWNRPLPGAASTPPEPSPVPAAAAPTTANVPPARRPREFTRPRLTMPGVDWPRFSVPALTMPRPRVPRVSGIVLIVAGILALLLIVPLAYVLLPAGRAAVDRQNAGHLPLTNGPAAGETARAAAIAGGEAKTHPHYQATKSAADGPCLTAVNDTMGKDAAAVGVFAARCSGGQLVRYG